MIDEQGLWELIKDSLSYCKYFFLSREQKRAFNVRSVQERYWFQQLVKEHPSISTFIEEDQEFRAYFSSRKRVRKLLRNKDERTRFIKRIKSICG